MTMENKIRIREATIGDASVMAQIRYEASLAGFSKYIRAETLKECTDTRKYRQAVAENLRCGKMHYLICEWADVPAGMLSWQSDEEKGEIVSLHTLPHSWGTGIAVALLADVLKCMRVNGLDTVYLWTFEKNVRARRFYEKNGFCTDGTVRMSCYDREPEVRYVRSLKKN